MQRGLSGTANGEVLDDAGRVIPGLFACGNDLASIFRGTYPGPGTTLGPAIVFGWRIAKFAAHGEVAAGDPAASGSTAGDASSAAPHRPVCADAHD